MQIILLFFSLIYRALRCHRVKILQKNLVEWKFCSTFVPGEVAEWSIAAVLKTVELRGSGGSNPSLSASSGKIEIDGLWFSSQPFFMQCGALPNLFESALYCIKGVWSTTTNVYLYFSACKLRSKGKGDRRKPIPPVFKYRLLPRLILFYTTSLAVKKHLPTAKWICLRLRRSMSWARH